MEPIDKSVAPAKQSLVSTAWLQWKPLPLAIPRLDPGFSKMDQIQRTAEALRYLILKFEHWISPQGNLREWLRWNTAAAIILGIPALLVVPVITFLLGQFATWSALIRETASNLIIFPITGIIGIALLSAIALLIRLILPR
ncbi:hypothetical protein ACXR0O_08750 [Verrucomicrobiota bacterium sgz303538]